MFCLLFVATRYVAPSPSAPQSPRSTLVLGGMVRGAREYEVVVFWAMLCRVVVDGVGVCGLVGCRLVVCKAVVCGDVVFGVVWCLFCSPEPCCVRLCCVGIKCAGP